MFGSLFRRWQKKDESITPRVVAWNGVVARRYVKFPKKLTDLDESYRALVRELAKR